MLDRIANEPALALGAVQAAIALAIGFGLDLTAEQVSLIVAFTAALLALWTRHEVTPTRTYSSKEPPRG